MAAQLTEEDVLATDDAAREAVLGAHLLTLAFPRGWPAVFRENARLKAFVGKKQLGGSRCRAVEPPGSSDVAAATATGLNLSPLRSFAIADGLCASMGWPVVKGFLALELLSSEVEISAGLSDVRELEPGSSFVALRHWWNCKPDGSWIDLTPPLMPHAADARALLVESAKGVKEVLAATAASERFGADLLERLAGGAPGRSPSDAPPGAPPAPPEPPAPVVSGKSSEERAHGAYRRAPKARGLDLSRWDKMVEDEDVAEADAHRAAEAARAARAAQAQAAQEAAMRSALAEAQAKILAAQKEAEQGRKESLDEILPKLKQQGLMAMPRDDLTKFGLETESEQERRGRHQTSPNPNLTSGR